MASIECRDRRCAESFGRRDDGGVDYPEWEVGVALDELRNPQPVRRMDRIGDQISHDEVTQESKLRVQLQATTDQVCRFGDCEQWDEQRAACLFEQLETTPVRGIVRIDVGDERTGVDYERRTSPQSSARISSIRDAMSPPPLAPAPAARKRRRGPLPFA